MHARLASLLVVFPVVVVGLLGAGCRCCCPRPAESAGPHCPDVDLPRDDALQLTLSGRALVRQREVDAKLHAFCQMSLAGHSPLKTPAGDRFELVSIELFAAGGELSAEQALAQRCRGFARLPFPAHRWTAPHLETEWDGSRVLTLAARVVYLHHFPDGSLQRVYTLAGGHFRNLDPVTNVLGNPIAGNPTDQDTITSMTAGGVFLGSSQTALYDVSVDFSNPNPATSVELFSAKLEEAGSIFDGSHRILYDAAPTQAHWSAQQVPAPYTGAPNMVLAVQVTYSTGAFDRARRSFLDLVGADHVVPLE